MSPCSGSAEVLQRRENKCAERKMGLWDFLQNTGVQLTIGMPTLNREFVIGKALESLVAQTFPHDKLFVIVSDGQSTDATVEKAVRVLELSDIKYRVVSARTNAAEAKNLCIDNMKGGAMLFWDSDVMLEPTGIQTLVNVANSWQAHIVMADGKNLAAHSLTEIERQIADDMAKPHEPCKVIERNVVPMCCTLVHGNVLKNVRFNDNLVIVEDPDFSIRSRQHGYKIVGVKNIREYDMHVYAEKSFSYHITLPLSTVWKNMKISCKLLAMEYSLKPSLFNPFRLLWKCKRYAFYLGYLPIIILSLIGVAIRSVWLVPVFPVYLVAFAALQVRHRGLTLGLKSALRSLTVGLPSAVLTMVYLFKFLIGSDLIGHEKIGKCHLETQHGPWWTCEDCKKSMVHIVQVKNHERA